LLKVQGRISRELVVEAVASFQPEQYEIVSEGPRVALLAPTDEELELRFEGAPESLPTDDESLPIDEESLPGDEEPLPSDDEELADDELKIDDLDGAVPDAGEPNTATETLAAEPATLPDDEDSPLV
jgi:hypothetical protein